jgi:hypothetical protein
VVISELCWVTEMEMERRNVTQVRARARFLSEYMFKLNQWEEYRWSFVLLVLLNMIHLHDR